MYYNIKLGVCQEEGVDKTNHAPFLMYDCFLIYIFKLYINKNPYVKTSDVRGFAHFCRRLRHLENVQGVVAGFIRRDVVNIASIKHGFTRLMRLGDFPDVG